MILMDKESGGRNEMPRKPARVVWLDRTKGFAMALVLIGHSMRDEMRSASPILDLIYRMVYIFHMTCYFWIAGYTYRMARDRGRKPLETAWKRLKKQLPPWAGYTVFIYFVFTLVLHLPAVGRILEQGGYSGLTPGAYLLAAFKADNPWAYHLWFLYVLMLLTVLISLCDAAFGGKRLRGICVALILAGIAGMALRVVFPLGDWWRLYDYITRYLPVVCLGILMAEWKISDRMCMLWGAAGLLYIVVRALFFSGFSGNSLRVEDPLLRFGIYVAADLLLPGVILSLNRIFEKEWLPFTRKGRVFLEFLGRESMLIYLLHQPFCCAFLGMVLYNKLHLPAVPVMAVCLAASLLVPWAALRLIKGGK